jgi:hypothetical protein
VAWVNQLPLFCDTIFIMALSFFAGPWWGVLAGFFYHLIDFALHRTMELGHLFMLCHFLAALTAGYFKILFIKKSDSRFLLFVKLNILVIVLCLVMSVSGGIISYILNNIEAYNKASMDMLDKDKRHCLFNADLPVFTKTKEEVSTYYSVEAKSRNSLIADNCITEGSVENSIVFSGCRIGKGAVLKNCVVMRNCIIGEGCELEKVIVDKDCVFSEDCKLTGNAKLPVVVPKASKL